MYKIDRQNELNCLQGILDRTYPDHSYPTRSRHRIKLPFPRVENIRMNFNYQFCAIWNDIPNSIKRKPTLSMFKRCLIEYFLQSYV